MRRLPIPWATVGFEPRSASARSRTSAPPRPFSAKSRTCRAWSAVSPLPPASLGFRQLVDHGVATDLGELVECPQHRPAPAGESLGIEKPVEDLAVIERDREVGDAGRVECGVDDLGDLGVGDDALGADRVEVALHELAEPPLGGPLAAKHRADGVPLERHPERIDVLGDEPGQRHGQVEPQRQLAGRPSFIGDLEDLPQDLFRAGPLAGQDLHPLDMRRLDRHEAEPGERLAEHREHALAGNHHRRRQVSQAAGNAGVDHGARSFLSQRWRASAGWSCTPGCKSREAGTRRHSWPARSVFYSQDSTIVGRAVDLRLLPRIGDLTGGAALSI